MRKTSLALFFALLAVTASTMAHAAQTQTPPAIVAPPASKSKRGTPATPPNTTSPKTGAPAANGNRAATNGGNAPVHAQQPAACASANEKSLQNLTLDDANLFASSLNGWFSNFKVSAAYKTATNTSVSLCITGRKTDAPNPKCDKSAAPDSNARNRCYLDDVIERIDAEFDYFRGMKSLSSFLVHISNLPVDYITRYFYQPASELSLEKVDENYLLLRPRTAPQGASADSQSAPDPVKDSAAIKQDLEKIDDLISRAKLDKANGDKLKVDFSKCPGPDSDSPLCTVIEEQLERWLQVYTVRLSFLEARDVALALTDANSIWILGTHPNLKALYLLPSDSANPTNQGLFEAADAIERDTLYRQKEREAANASQQQQSQAGSGTKPPAADAASTKQPAQSGGAAGTSSTNNATTMTTTVTVGQATTPPAAGPTTPGTTPPGTTTTPPSNGTASNPPANGGGTQGTNPQTTPVASQSSTTPAPGNGAGPGQTPKAQNQAGQQPLNLANVVRLYHLRDSAGIAAAINAAFDKNQPAVVALTDGGNNDLVMILPTPAGTPDRSMDIRRAIALLDLPRPQLSLQVWTYQVSEDTTGIRDQMYKAKAASRLRESSEQMRNAVDDADIRMMKALQSGFGKLVADANAKGESYYDTTFSNYLTKKYENCVQKDSYCLGYLSALTNPAGSSQSSFVRLLLLLMAGTDLQAAGEVHDVIKAMNEEAGGCEKHKPDDGLLCFDKFRDQLTRATQSGNLHVLRAALLDFLFAYKWTINYPNDFVPYDLDTTAHYLDGLLAPIIDAFNQDVDSYVQAKMKATSDLISNRRKSSGMASQGLVQVATLSGTQAIVDGKVFNYFDITPSLTLNDLLNTSNQSNLASSLKTILEPKEILLLQVLGNINSQPRITAEVTKEAKLTITPVSLDTASSAELNVDFDVSEPTAPTTGDKTVTRDILDRVSDHHVTTHVRVDSLRLFQLSAFTMELTHPERGTPVPVVGQVWEAFFGNIPGIGNLLRLPPYSKTEDNQSMVIVRAVVVPTAMDIGLSLRFEADRVLDPVTNATDFLSSVEQAGGRLRPFHEQMMLCLLSRADDSSCSEDQGKDKAIKLSRIPIDLRTPTTH
jgi:hypothetical protein